MAWFGLAATCGLVWAAAVHPIRDPDFGWHLALGRYIARHHSVPTAEPFTHTALGRPMVAHEWLAQLAMYAASTPAGIVGLRWLHATAVVALLLAFYRMLRGERAPPAFALAGVVAFALAARSRFEIRPQMFNLAAMMALYHVVFVRRARLGAAQRVGIAVAVAVWANLHSGVVLFPALVGVYFVTEWLGRSLGGWRADPSGLGEGRLSRVIWLGVLSGLATLATPNHVRLIPYVFESSRINRGLSAEWSSIWTFFGDPANLPLESTALAVSALAFGVALWIGRRRYSPATAATAAVLALLPLISARFVDFCFAPIGFAVTVASARFAERRDRGRLLRRVSLGIYAIVGLSLPTAFLGAIDTAQWRLWIRPAGDFQPVTFPEGAVRFLDEVGFEGRLYQLERWGGYVLLRTGARIPIFIDGRWVTIGETVVADALRIEHRDELAFDRLDQYAIDVLLVPRGWMTATLRRERGWVTAFENFNAGVYLRASAADDLARCRRYYRQRNIPFPDRPDPERGFDGRLAQSHNPDWARAFRVGPRHVVHFGLVGNPIGVSPERVVDDW